MGKKGAKRKTRWRSLSIGAPPGEEDEEEEVHNGYKLENGNGSARGERNIQGGYSSYKRTRPYNNPTNTYGYGYGSLYNGQSKSSQSKNEEDPTKPKIVFNEEEYMRITTPRQDVLFKKGYLSRKKPLASTASTSATSATTTPSTNESQSAAHSTADGSETAEDQQLLDGSNGEFAILPEAAAAQFGYGGFYDQVTGYYYEYPVMLVNPPVPGHPNPNVLAAMPCGPVPLRPVEWFNPQYMPEMLQEQYPPPHFNDSQAGSSGSSVSMDEANGTGTPANIDVSCSDNKDEEVAEDAKEPVNQETTAEVSECVQPAQIIPQLVPHMHMPPQHYMYPGHFMFGPPMVNMNGVTIQNSAIVPNDVLWTKRRKRRKRRKQRRPLAVGNTEDEEEEYSSDWESGSNWSQPAWSTDTTYTSIASTGTSRPLNPEVQEFQFRSTLPILSDANDEPTVVSKDVDKSLASHPIETADEGSEDAKTENETRLVTIDNVNLSSIGDAESKDVLSETNLENTRVNQTGNIVIVDSSLSCASEIEQSVLDYTDVARTDTNGEIVHADILTDTIVKKSEEIAHPLLNGTVIFKEDESVPTNSDGALVENVDTSEELREDNDNDHLRTVAAETTITNSFIETKVIDDPITNQTDFCEDPKTVCLSINDHPSKDQNHNNSNFAQEENPEVPTKINGQNGKCATSEADTCNTSPVANSKRPDNDTSSKKGGSKNVKKGKTKAMDARKPGRNKREARNPQRNDVGTSSASPSESPQGRDSSNSPDSKQPSECLMSELPPAKPSSRPTSPEINLTTTPINAETHRLPESYESLVTRSSPPTNSPPLPLIVGGPIAPPRRKYSAKGLKFVREPTPGPDLDTEIKSDNEEANKINDHLREQGNQNESTSIDQGVSTSTVPENVVAQETNENKNTTLFTEVYTVVHEHAEEGSREDLPVSRIESQSNTQVTSLERSQKVEEQLETVTTETTSNSEELVATIDPNSSETNLHITVQEGVEIAAPSVVGILHGDADGGNEDANTSSRLSDHPITDAVTAWLERSKSPEMFRVPMPLSVSDDSDLSETEIDDGDPNEEPSKNLNGNPMPALSVSNKSIDNCRRTLSNVVTGGTVTKTDTFDTSKTIERRREKDINNIEYISPTNENGRSIEEIVKSVGVCDFTIEGRAAGMRVAENSRVDLNKVNKKQKRWKENSKKKYIENIEMKVKSYRSNDDLTENGIEALENVKTYERGEIVVSMDGKLLPGTIYDSTCLEKSDLQDSGTTEEVRESNSNRRESCKSQAESIELDRSFVPSGNSQHEMSPEDTVYSLGSIEEPDVLECWETELVEPVVILKNNRQLMKLQVDGEVQDGEATEEENYDNRSDPTTREHVKKYYRLAREYTISVEDELSERALKQMNSNNVNSNSNSPKRTTPNTPERMIECLCSEEIPIIVPLPKSASSKVNKVVNDGKQVEVVDEAFEVYESYYTEKTRSAGVPQLNVEGSKIPFQNQEGPIPCKAVCCNIQ